jgi:hypothetical protein
MAAGTGVPVAGLEYTNAVRAGQADRDETAVRRDGDRKELTLLAGADRRAQCALYSC